MNSLPGIRLFAVIFGFLFLAELCPVALAAPRELWSKPVGIVSDPAWAMQIFADGTGGAAAICANGNVPKPEGGYERLRYTIVWFNAAGRELWRKVFEVPADDSDGSTSVLRVNAANRYAVVVQFYYQVYKPGGVTVELNETTVISRSGAETDVDEVNTIDGLNGGAGEPKNVYSDVGGFFGFRVGPDNTISLVRHTFR